MIFPPGNFDFSGTTVVPYLRTAGEWYQPDSFQIITAGLDGGFGDGAPDIARVVKAGAGLTIGDSDNQTNFTKASTLKGDVD